MKSMISLKNTKKGIQLIDKKCEKMISLIYSVNV